MIYINIAINNKMLINININCRDYYIYEYICIIKIN